MLELSELNSVYSLAEREVIRKHVRRPDSAAALSGSAATTTTLDALQRYAPPSSRLQAEALRGIETRALQLAVVVAEALGLAIFKIKLAIVGAVQRLADNALDAALITQPEARDPDLMARLDAVAGRVL